MFEILYRITEDINEISNMRIDEFDRNDIDGFFQLKFNSNTYGEYTNISPLDEDAYSFVYITKWFRNIINALVQLDENEYVAINDTESYNTWIEFKKIENTIITGIIQAEKEDGEKEIRIIPLENGNYSEWKDESVNLEEFRSEIINKLLMYIDEVIKINPDLINSKELNNLKDKVDIIKGKVDIGKIDWKRLREGKDVTCPLCKEGILITSHDPKTSKSFRCNKCGMKINMD